MKKVLVFLTLTVVLLMCLVSCFEQPEHTHNFGEWSTTKNATCTEDGVKTRYCDCGEKQSDTISATGHNYVDNVCTNCGVEHIMSACKHDDPEKIVVVDYKSPTCIETGLTEGMKCLNCETMVVPQMVIPVTECIDLKTLPYKAPTCQETGLTEGKQCNICGTVVVEQDVLSKIDCVESNWIVDKEATKTEDGKKHTECTMCHRKMQDVVLPAGSQGLSYELNDDGKGYSVTGIGNCTDKDIVIPRTYNGLPVTTIGNDAFSECTSFTSVAIPDSVTTIGNSAFYRCASLTSVVIPDSVTTIGDSAFHYCHNLTSVVIPDSVTSIGNTAFSGCIRLTSIDVDDNNQNYKSVDGNLYSKDGKTLIQYASGKQDSSFVIPDSVTSIGDSAFKHCSSLTSIVIPDSVTTIGNSAFYRCRSLTSVVIPDSVTSIGDYAFDWCTSLTSVAIPDSVTTIGDSAFFQCTSLISATIGNGVTSIGNGAFQNCTSLTSVTIGNGVMSIGNEAFQNCPSLISINIPASVTSIGDYAFSGCSLKDIKFEGTVAQWNAISLGASWNSGVPATYVQCSDGIVPLK